MKKLGFLNSDFSWNKIGKDRFVIFLIGGLLLLVIVFPMDSTNKRNVSKQEQTKRYETRLSEEEQQVSGITGAEDLYNMDYSQYMEQQLEEILCCIEGVGKAKVLVTTRQSETKIVEKDNPNERKNVYETGIDGENQNTMELINDTATVYTEDENGHKVPFVTTLVQPKVEGVVVVLQGGENEQIKKQITEVIQALFDIEVHKIKVVKMKGENQ